MIEINWDEIFTVDQEILEDDKFSAEGAYVGAEMAHDNIIETFDILNVNNRKYITQEEFSKTVNALHLLFTLKEYYDRDSFCEGMTIGRFILENYSIES